MINLKFDSYDPFIKTLKTDKSARLELALNPSDVGRLIDAFNGFSGELTVCICEKGAEDERQVESNIAGVDFAPVVDGLNNLFKGRRTLKQEK